MGWNPKALPFDSISCHRMNHLSPETRASLLLKLQDSADVVAWQEFTEIYSPVIHRTAKRIGLQTADADNVVQEVLFAVSKSIHLWLERGERTGFRGWLFRIARNKALDLLTRRATRPEFGSQVEWDDLAQPESATATFWDFEYRWELFSRAATEVRRTAADSTWEAFWLSTIEGRSVPEVAQSLGVREGVVYLSRCRIMDRIRKLVKQWETHE
jgi:RNA polymerase sigma-70 factor (ECF subfamily)